MTKIATGRPPFKPTAAHRRTVSIAAGAGMTHEEIAIGLGISTPTLRKYFEVELSVHAYLRRLEVYEAMHKAALAGNVTAQRAYAAMSPAPAAPPDPDPAGDSKPAGKKAQAAADAVTAHVGSDWEDLLARPAAPGVQ